MILNNHRNRRSLSAKMIDALDTVQIKIYSMEALEESFRSKSDEEFDELWNDWHEERQRWTEE